MKLTKDDIVVVDGVRLIPLVIVGEVVEELKSIGKIYDSEYYNHGEIIDRLFGEVLDDGVLE